MFNFLQYGFVIRGLEAGLIIGVIAPLIGIFLVLRRYSLIADTLSHVSLAGVAIGLLVHINPLLTAVGTTALSSIIIEKLRLSKRIYGESALSIFLSGSLALSIVLISVTRGINVDIFSYLFGSILTVTQNDVNIILGVGTVVLICIVAFYKQLIFVTFDEEAAWVSGIPTRLINTLLILLSAVTISLSIPVVGVLLISALIVIPVVSALQLKRGFKQTILIAEGFSVFSVIAGIMGSFYFNLPAGGTIVLISIAIFFISFYLPKIH